MSAIIESRWQHCLHCCANSQHSFRRDQAQDNRVRKRPTEPVRAVATGHRGRQTGCGSRTGAARCHNRDAGWGCHGCDSARPLGTLRVSVTDRCNLRCALLHAGGGIRLAAAGRPADASRRSIGSSAIFVVAGRGTRAAHRRRAAAAPRSAGPRRAGWRARPGLAERALTTNGVHLAAQAAALRAAGLDRVTVSLDTLQADRFLRLSRSRDLDAPSSPASRPPSADVRHGQARYRGHPRRERRRAAGARRVRRPRRRRNPLHRIHGRRRRDALVGLPGRAARPRSSPASSARSARSTPIGQPRHAPATRYALPTARRSASSRRRPSRSAAIAIGPG